ncbi:MAG: RIP metalloprotease RseP [Abditibacteriota bacterium]|nr:RIP metalloprotease RseP [Abditibacteriota bacterium]
MLIIETIIALIIVFALLVIFHECGHYLAARWAGMRVDEFSLGFGPIVRKLFNKSGTQFNLRWIPLGGFVNIAGMEPGSEETIPDGFQAKSLWKRALVVFAGPFASFLLALILFLVIGVGWGFVAGKTLNKILVVNPNTPAAEAGLRAGDTITAINDIPVKDGRDMVDRIHTSPGRPLKITVLRNKKVFDKTITPQWNITFLNAVWTFDTEKKTLTATDATPKDSFFKKGDVLTKVNGRKVDNPYFIALAGKRAGGHDLNIEYKRNGKTKTAKQHCDVLYVDYHYIRWYFPGGYARPADEKNTIKTGDKIVKIDDKVIVTAEDMLKASDDKSGRSVTITVDRNGEKLTFKRSALAATPSASDFVGLIGVMPQNELIKPGFVKSIKMGFIQFGYVIALLVDALKPQNIGANIGGPIMIAGQTSTMVSLGVYYVAQMAALLSLSLAVMNILPIPVLDGGHLLLIFIEWIRRRRLTAREMQRAQMIGLAILAFIIIYVMCSDITRYATGNIPR